ncbi:MAG: ATP-binding cassette domain-containing protein, partial [Methanoregula sp.]|nr:ATP-binding cassette domain-containing protein [Methanoregula sp.]
MGVLIIKIILDQVNAIRDQWSLTASGTFEEGVHLVSGDVGSGKSTMALIIAGLFPLSGGSMKKDGITSSMLSLQFPELHVTGLTVAEECTSWGVSPDDILDITGLTGKRDISPLFLSRGELKRLHLACILAKDHDLLLLDEPFSSLDCEEKAKLCECISQKSQVITIIFTHEQEILPRVTRIWEIVNGMLVDCGTPPDAFLKWHHVPPIIEKLTALGCRPENLSLD